MNGHRVPAINGMGGDGGGLPGWAQGEGCQMWVIAERLRVPLLWGSEIAGGGLSKESN